MKTAAPATSHSRLLVMADAVDVGDSGIGLSPISGRRDRGRGEGACLPIPKTISPTAPKKQRAKSDLLRDNEVPSTVNRHSREAKRLSIEVVSDAFTPRDAKKRNRRTASRRGT